MFRFGPAVFGFFADGKLRTAPDFRVVFHDIPKGNAAAYFPETNVLVGIDEYAVKSLTPMSKFIEISMSLADIVEPTPA